MTRDRRGFAILAVILVLALLGVVITEFALSMRLEAAAARAYKQGIVATHLAEAGIEQAIREILSDSTVQGVDENGTLIFYQVTAGLPVPRPLPLLQRTRVPLGPGEFSYRITDEESRLNLNTASPEQLERLLDALGVDRRVRDVIRDSLLDWKDADDQFRLNGAESDDTYLKQPVPYRARNGNLEDVRELLQIKGVTPELYRGTSEQPGLAEFVTAHGRGSVNLNTAGAPVLKALNLADAQVTAILQTRVRIPYTQAGLSAFPQAAGRVVGSQVFRIEAEGYVAGEPRARITAIVERGGAQGGNPLGQALSGTASRQPLSGGTALGQPLSGSAPRQALSGTAPRQPLSGTAPRQPLTVLSWRPGEER
jgi:general secretion pathway protein K